MPQELHRKNFITPDDLPDQMTLRRLLDSGALDVLPSNGGAMPLQKFVSRAEHASTLKQQMLALRGELQADFDQRLEALDQQYRGHMETTIHKVCGEGHVALGWSVGRRSVIGWQD